MSLSNRKSMSVTSTYIIQTMATKRTHRRFEDIFLLINTKRKNWFLLTNKRGLNYLWNRHTKPNLKYLENVFKCITMTNHLPNTNPTISPSNNLGTILYYIVSKVK